MRGITMGLALFFATSFGCAHHQTAGVPPDTAASEPGGTRNSPLAKASCMADGDCGAGKLCVNQACIDISAHPDLCASTRVHFALDSSEIPEVDRDQLERSARCIKVSPGTKLTIEGNTDERGTEEYNLALGERRARSVAGYLEKLGATPAQLKTVSYGKDNPLCSEHDEACWEKNRRANVSPPKKDSE